MKLSSVSKALTFAMLSSKPVMWSVVSPSLIHSVSRHQSPTSPSRCEYLPRAGLSPDTVLNSSSFSKALAPDPISRAPRVARKPWDYISPGPLTNRGQRSIQPSANLFWKRAEARRCEGFLSKSFIFLPSTPNFFFPPPTSFTSHIYPPLISLFYPLLSISLEAFVFLRIPVQQNGRRIRLSLILGVGRHSLSPNRLESRFGS